MPTRRQRFPGRVANSAAALKRALHEGGSSEGNPSPCVVPVPGRDALGRSGPRLDVVRAPGHRGRRHPGAPARRACPARGALGQPEEGGRAAALPHAREPRGRAAERLRGLERHLPRLPVLPGHGRRPLLLHGGASGGDRERRVGPARDLGRRVVEAEVRRGAEPGSPDRRLEQVPPRHAVRRSEVPVPRRLQQRPLPRAPGARGGGGDARRLREARPRPGRGHQRHRRLRAVPRHRAAARGAMARGPRGGPARPGTAGAARGGHRPPLPARIPSPPATTPRPGATPPGRRGPTTSTASRGSPPRPGEGTSSRVTATPT